MKVLVTGASGFLGSHLCRALVERGHLVRALLRRTSPVLALKDLTLEYRYGDLFDRASLDSAANGVDVVFHCAGQVARWRRSEDMIASHIEGTRNMLSAAQVNGNPKFIYTSSVAALGIPLESRGAGGGPLMMDEAHAWNTTPSVWPYGYAKHMAEQLVLGAAANGLDAVVLNPSVVLGSGDVHRYHVGLVGRMLAGRLPPLAPPGGLNAIHIDDVVAGHLAALELGVPGRRYILGGENLTHAALLSQVARALGKSGPRLRVPAWPLRVIGRGASHLTQRLPLPHWLGLLAMAGLHFYYDISRARSELGFDPQKSIAEALSQAASWYKTHAPELA